MKREQKNAPHTITLARARSERLIAAMLSCRTLDEAAKQAHVSRRTLFEVRKDPEFMRRYQEAADQVLESTINQLRTNATRATDTLRQVCTDKKQYGQARVRASEVILNTLLKSVEMQEIVRRVARLEAIAAEEATSVPK